MFIIISVPGPKHQSSKQQGVPTLKSAGGTRQKTNDDVVYQGPDTPNDYYYNHAEGKKIYIAQCLLVTVF